MASQQLIGLVSEPAEKNYRTFSVNQDDKTAATDYPSRCSSGFLIGVSILFCILFWPIGLYLVVKVVPEYQRVVLFRLGRIKDEEAKGPGILFVLPCVDSYVAVDLRTHTFNVQPQQVLSKDSVPVHVDAVVYYRIFDPIISVTNVVDVGRATRLLAQTTLRTILGGHTLAEILSQRDIIQQQYQQHLGAATETWGAKVERVEIKDVRLPQTMQRAMAAEAEAAREARAKVIAAQGELNSARALKEAAEVIGRSPTALKLRYLQTLNVIVAEGGSTIIFPMPIDFNSNLLCL